MSGKTAIIFGSTGLTGSYLLDFLVLDDRYEKIIRFIRKPSKISHPKIKDIISNLDDLSAYKNEIHGDEVYICLGTTIKVAGSQSAFRKVDYDFPVQVAEIAAENGIPVIAVISSIGADAASSNFYLKTKGEMETAINSKNIKYTYFFRPSMLLGDRKEQRSGEYLMKNLMQVLSFLFIGPLKKYKAIHVKKVAASMISTVNSKVPSRVISSENMHG